MIDPFVASYNKSSKSIKKLMAAAEKLSAALQLFYHSCSYQ